MQLRQAGIPERVRQEMALFVREALVDDVLVRAERARKGSPFLCTKQAAFYLGLTARRLQAMRAGREGPRFRRHSRYVVYHIDDLDSWSDGSGRVAGNT